MANGTGNVTCKAHVICKALVMQAIANILSAIAILLLDYYASSIIVIRMK